MRGLVVPYLSIPSAPDTVYTIVATAGSTTYPFAWPSGARVASFSGNCDFFVDYATTGAVIPSTNSFGSTSQELNPTIREIPTNSTGGSLTSPSSGIVTISFWKK